MESVWFEELVGEKILSELNNEMFTISLRLPGVLGKTLKIVAV